MLATADGVGIVTENIFSGRFRYIDELVRMGADIRTEGHHAVVRGQAALSGAPVRAHDIRAGAALVVAALRADGETVVSDADHIDRGYEGFVEKLRRPRAPTSTAPRLRSAVGTCLGASCARRRRAAWAALARRVGQLQEQGEHGDRGEHHQHLVPPALVGEHR